MKHVQGEKWRRLDNTAKLFPVIANEHLSNVFRISAVLKEEVERETLQQALEEVLPRFEGFRVKLRRGFFWYYFETNRRTPLVEREETYPCRYIDPHSSQMYLFRVSYYRKRINLEVFHVITDGMGAVNFLKAIVCRYLELKKGGGPAKPGSPELKNLSASVEDSYLKNYKETAGRKYSSCKAYHLKGEVFPLDEENIVHGFAGLEELKRESRALGTSITKYLAAGLIWSIYQEYLHGRPGGEKIGVNVPVNLRAFFDSETMANFFAVVTVEFLPVKEGHTFEEILESVSRQMDEKITKEKMEETISYNVSSEKKWYIRIAPLFLKWAALNLIFRKNDRAYTMTLSNIGPVKVAPEYEGDIDGFLMLIGVSPRQPVKCGVCSYADTVTVTFSSVFRDNRLSDAFFGFLREKGIPVRLESNGVSDTENDRGTYPGISYDPDKWRKLVRLFYAVLFMTAAVLGIVNYASYSGSLWSVIAIGGIIYTALTVKYSVMHHANLASKVVVQTLAACLLLAAVDYATGRGGWSVNYAIPGIILFADIAVVFLIVVNRMNWQSYFMYQLAVTIFSFVPMLLWAAGLVTRPLMAFITAAATAFVLAVTVILGDRSVKNELKRRFHL